MHNNQVSIIVAGLLLLSFFLFMGGYFLGQKNAITAFSNKIEQESFSDQIYSSMCSLSDNGQVEEDGQENEEKLMLTISGVSRFRKQDRSRSFSRATRGSATIFCWRCN